MSTCMQQRLKNPYFWVGLVGLVIATLGVDAQSLTTWGAVGVLFWDTVQNPVKICAVCMAVLGIFVDPTTKGIADSDQHGSREV